MFTAKLRLVALALLVHLLAWTPAVATEKRGRLLTRDEVATTWVGISEDELYLLRIVLLPSGGGTMGYSFLDEQPHVLRVDSWKYDPAAGSAIRILQNAPDHSGQHITLGGEVVGVRMELVLSGKDWKRKVSLRREADLEPRWKRLKERMAEPLSAVAVGRRRLARMAVVFRTPPPAPPPGCAPAG